MSDIQKSLHDHINSQKQLIASQFETIDPIVESISTKALEKAESIDIEKGGKRAFIGEKRTFGGREYIKTAQGWKFHGKGGGKKAQEHAKSGEGKQEESPSGAPKKKIEDHAKEASEEQLNKVVKEGTSPELRAAAHAELARRKKEEHVEEDIQNQKDEEEEQSAEDEAYEAMKKRKAKKEQNPEKKVEDKEEVKVTIDEATAHAKEKNKKVWDKLTFSEKTSLIKSSMNELRREVDKSTGGNHKKDKTYKVSSTGKDEFKKHTLVSTDGEHQIDMEFDSEDAAKKYAEKKGVKMEEEGEEYRERKISLIKQGYKLLEFSKDKDPLIRAAVAQEGYALATLANDSDQSVRKIAQARIDALDAIKDIHNRKSKKGDTTPKKEERLEKTSNEDSKTSSGKKINLSYMGNHKDYEEFTPQDHIEAALFHRSRVKLDDSNSKMQTAVAESMKEKSHFDEARVKLKQAQKVMEEQLDLLLPDGGVSMMNLTLAQEIADNGYNYIKQHDGNNLSVQRIKPLELRDWFNKDKTIQAKKYIKNTFNKMSDFAKIAFIDSMKYY